MERVSATAFLLAAAMVTGCSSLHAPEEDHRAGSPTRTTTLSVDSTVVVAELRSHTQSYIDAVLGTITSDAFAAALTRVVDSLGGALLSPLGDRVDGLALLELYRHGASAPRELPPTLAWSDGDGAITEVVPGSNRARIVLGIKLLPRWLSPDPARRSCAVNTLAHELSHTISLRPDAFRHAIADRGRTFATLLRRPLASYTIGAVAQCTYQAQHGLLAHDSVLACVRMRGVNIAKQSGCDGP